MAFLRNMKTVDLDLGTELTKAVWKVGNVHIKQVFSLYAINFVQEQGLKQHDTSCIVEIVIMKQKVMSDCFMDSNF